MRDKKERKSVEYFSYLSNLVSDERCTREIKLRFVTAKTEFNKKNSFLQQIGLRFQDETFWSFPLYCAKTWTLRKIDQKYLKVLKTGAGEGC